ncbi:hypothetical protein ACBY01_01525 [Sphingomonas sp. ac-8]|uniref:hypothetical protein n=1 Tax=Sphingomonas sp. ac-8 TaxID=3242977 RepID=UPI003A80236C
MSLGTARSGKASLPSDVSTSMAILESMTGSSAQARILASGAAWPGSSYLAAGTAPLTSAQARAATPGSSVRIGNVVYTASALLQHFTQMRARDQVEAAIARLNLDRNQASHVLSAYAYVWARNMAPMIPRFFWKLPNAGDAKGVNERFAQALGRYERDNPGTVFLASRGDPAAQRAVEIVLDQSLSGAVVNPPIQISERTSSVSPALSASSTRARALLGIQSNRSWVAHHLVPFASVAALPRSVQQAIAASG